MARTGRVKKMGDDEKSFAGSAAEGQKGENDGQDEATGQPPEEPQSDPPEGEGSQPPEEPPSLPSEGKAEPVPPEEETKPEPPTFDKEGATYVISHRNGLKKVWYRDGEVIGVEDAG